ncbi:MAG: radical SAM protein [Kiritimatiellia bacterium]
MNALEHCELCPRQCGVDRARGEVGYCGSGATLKLFRWGPHFGEEPPLSGTKGSGAIFFSHCTMRCIYCQNGKWSNGGCGEEITVDELTHRLRTLAEQGCHNWNLVSPTPWLPLIEAAAEPLIKAGISLPFVYNTSGFERTETLEAHRALTSIALADLRYASETSAREGSDCAGYVAAARNAIQWFWNTLGPLECDSQGIAQRGLIVRLLALPGRENEVIDNLVWLRNTLGTQVSVSVMAQYNPVGQASVTAGWNRRIRPEDFATISDLVEDLGFENGWVQACEEETSEQMLGNDMTEGYGTVK